MVCVLFFFKQKTAYELRISDWSSDVCSSDLGFPSGPFSSLAWQARPPRVKGVRSAFWQGDQSGGSTMAEPGTPPVVGIIGGSGIYEIEIGRAPCRERVCQYV